MFAYLAALILIALSLLFITLQKTYYYLPLKELKRQASSGDPLAKTLYRAVAYGPSLQLVLWLLIGVSSAGALMLLAKVAPPIFGFVAMFLLLLVAFAWLPSTRVTSFGARLAMLSTPSLVWVISQLYPILDRVTSFTHAHYSLNIHTGLYQRDDLIDLLNSQKSQSDSRIPEEEINLAIQALKFESHKVSDILIPRKKVKMVAATDTIGPMLLDELHKSGFTSFPVYEGKKDNTVGTLYMRKIGLKTEGQVRDYMEQEVYYLHENDSLAHALQVFYKTKHQLFVVVNSFEEYAGVATIEDILYKLIGQRPMEDFEEHSSKKAVAARHQKPHHDHKKSPKEEEPIIDETAKSDKTAVDPEATSG